MTQLPAPDLRKALPPRPRLKSVVAAALRVMTAPMCVGCGCTEENACLGGCQWLSHEPWVCSKCPWVLDVMAVVERYGMAGIVKVVRTEERDSRGRVVRWQNEIEEVG